MTELESLCAALVGRYDIGRELGSGGMAVVYLARDIHHDRPVALKVLRGELALATGAERFHREIRVAARLVHPLIIPLLDSGEAGGRLWYTMPFIEGESLRARLGREKVLPVDEAVRLTVEVAEALAHAHALGVLHRDIKPENILLSGGHALVADFGIARAIGAAADDALTGTGVAIGTPGYMSPEQSSGQDALDPRSDLYAIGCVCYEMLTGEPPFTGPTAQAIITRRLSQPAPSPRVLRPSIPETLDETVRRSLAPVPADRFATTSEFARALEAGLRAPARPGGRRAWRGVMAAAALLLVAVVAYRVAIHQTHRSDEPSESTIAVLPFVGPAGVGDDLVFGAGLAEELIAALSRVPGLRVAPRSSSFASQLSGLDTRAIGVRLGVGQVLEGTVRKAGGRLRVTAQLTSVSDGFARWTESFDRPEGDVLSLEQDLARAIASRLVPTLHGELVESAVRRGTTNPTAYDLYLQGRYYLGLRTGPGFERAQQLFERAIERDSAFARAWAGLADSYCIQANFGTRPAREVCPRSLVAARRALQLDSTLAEAHASLGFVHLFYEWDPAAAEQELRRAQELDPLSATAHLWLMQARTVRGDTAESIALMRRATALEPYSGVMNTRLGWALMRAGRLEEAVAQVRQGLVLDSSFTEGWRTLAVFYLLTYRADSALTLFKATDARVAWIAYAAALDQRTAEARRILAELAQDPVARRAQSLLIAYAWTALQSRDSALTWYRTAIVERVPDVVFSWVDPFLKELRADPRFARLADSSGVPRPDAVR